jgi:hypothetical protein
MDWSLIYQMWTSPSTFWGFVFFAIIMGSILGLTYSLLNYFKVQNVPVNFFTKGITMCVELFLGSAFILLMLWIFA